MNSRIARNGGRSMAWRHNGRKGVAHVLGVGESRLRLMESQGLLPKWDDVYADDYTEVAFLLVAGRAAGMPLLAVQRAISAIRRAASLDELDELYQKAWERAARVEGGPMDPVKFAAAQADAQRRMDAEFDADEDPSK